MAQDGNPVPLPNDASDAAADAPFLIGHFDLTLDEKGRLLIPSDVRKALDPDRHGTSLVVIRGSNGHIWIYPDRFYQKHIAPKLLRPVPSDNMLEYMLNLHGQSKAITPDKAGRVVLPEPTVDRAALGKDVTLVGVGNHLQLWPREEWRRFLDRTNKDLPRIAQRFAEETGEVTVR